ncbi:MAG: zinc-binding dehydrogenase [Steroidobacteraceae bacterium]
MHALARQRSGADATINYRSQSNWDEQVLSITHRAGVDLVAETGGSGTFKRSINATKMGGALSLIGMVDMTPSAVSPFELFSKNLHVHGIRVGDAESLSTLAEFCGKHQVKPVIDRVFEFKRAVAAYDHLKSGQHFGKVVIRIT